MIILENLKSWKQKYILFCWELSTDLILAENVVDPVKIVNNPDKNGRVSNTTTLEISPWSNAKQLPFLLPW